MDKTKLNETERIIKSAEIFLRENIKVYIKDIYGGLHFCNIIELYPDWIIIKYFKGNRINEKNRILWIDIEKLMEYKEKGELI